MIPMSDLESLIERLAALSGPDREVDARIAAAVGLPHGTLTFGEDGGKVYRSVVEIAPRYSESIDAALSLVPPGYYWSFDSRGCAIVSDKEPRLEPGAVGTCLGHQSPAIALCIAALRARAQAEEAGK